MLTISLLHCSVGTLVQAAPIVEVNKALLLEPRNPVVAPRTTAEDLGMMTQGNTGRTELEVRGTGNAQDAGLNKRWLEHLTNIPPGRLTHTIQNHGVAKEIGPDGRLQTVFWVLFNHNGSVREFHQPEHIATNEVHRALWDKIARAVDVKLAREREERRMREEEERRMFASPSPSPPWDTARGA